MTIELLLKVSCNKVVARYLRIKSLILATTESVFNVLEDSEVIEKSYEVCRGFLLIKKVST